MNIYECIVFICLFMALVPFMRNNKFLFPGAILMLIIIAVIRDISIGTDTKFYFSIFSNMNQGLDQKYDDTEYIFVLWNKFFYDVLNYDMYLVSVYTVILSLFGYVIYKYSNIRMLSLFLLVTLGYYTGSFNLMRQYIAIAIMLYGMNLFERVNNRKKNYYIFGILLLISFFIHHSSIVCGIFYLINKITVKKKIAVISVAATFILGFIFSEIVNEYLSRMTGIVGSGYAGYLDMYYEGKRNLFANAGVNLMFLATLFLSKNEDKDTMFMKNYLIYIVLFNLFGAMGFLKRVMLYFAPAQIIAIPNVLSHTAKPIYKALYWILIIAYALGTFYVLILKVDEILPYSIR